MKRVIIILILSFFTLPIAEAQDSTPPVLVDLQFNPSQVTPQESFDVIVTATDDISGLKQIELHITNPEGAQTFFVNHLIDSWSSFGDDKYSYSTSIENEFALAGEWYVSLVSIRDNAENSNTQSFNASNSPGTFTLNNTNSDNTPPELTDIQFNPSQVTPQESFDVIVTATDDISGLKQIELHITNPEGAQTFFVNHLIDSWSSLGDDKYSYSTSIENEFALAGEWYVSLVSIRDNAENSNTQSFNASNSPGTFTLNNTNSDNTPPELTDIQFNPSQVTPLESFDVIVTATDDISGLKQIELHITNPEGAQTFFVNHLIDSWSSLGDDKYSYSTSIENEFALAGEWYVSLVSIRDNAENSNTQSFNASNSPGTFSLCNPCDNEISSNDVIILNGDVVVSKANGFIMKSEQNGKCYRFKIIDAAVELEEVNCN